MNPLAARLYQLAPAWGQNLLLTGFGMLLDRERHGGRFAEYRDLLEKTEWQSRAELEAYQDERLRAKFTGSADKVVNLITFYAQEVREILAQGDAIASLDGEHVLAVLLDVIEPFVER